MEEAILATDLAIYFRNRDKFFQLVEQMNTNGQRDWSDENNRSLLRSMLMTCCDIAAITKPWLVFFSFESIMHDNFFFINFLH